MPMDVPFSHPINVRTLPKKGLQVRFASDSDLSKKLAEFADVLSVDAFETLTQVYPWKKGGVRVEGELKATLTQACAITGEPVHVEANDTFQALYVPAGSKLAQPKRDIDGEIILNPDGDDLPEEFSGDSIDLANIWSEFLLLAIDPYIKKDGATLREHIGEESPVSLENSPFAVLSSLKKH